ncbi:MAG: hypothetical protein OXP71_01190 [Candidatus Poribacteria bacterium]|nr:hypothetical protein [Candidatus Poribacteria bacterium]
MENQFGILDLLTLRGFDAHCKSKLVRHQDNDGRLINEGWFDRYQALKNKKTMFFEIVTLLLR